MTDGPRRGRRALVVSATSALLCAALYALAVLTAPGQRADVAGLALLTAPEPHLAGAARLVRALAPVAAALLLVAAGLVAVRRRAGGRVVAGAAGLPVAVLALATVLRDVVLPRPSLGVHGDVLNTFPSAHTATLAAACVAVVLLLGRRPGRGATALLAAVVLLTAWANVATQAHRPSDVVGSLLLVGVVAPWAALAARPRPGQAQPAPESTNRR
ncbi:phosphatase PAP2 family protein [Isoptericola sp. NPDC019693]|uniref:phosphatase PAP2 family protein n=1 Tax=Isoptericola sp. NPDC019693 TaxID=3364009 RepID=UPI0037B2681E